MADALNISHFSFSEVFLYGSRVSCAGSFTFLWFVSYQFVTPSRHRSIDEEAWEDFNVRGRLIYWKSGSLQRLTDDLCDREDGICSLACHVRTWFFRLVSDELVRHDIDRIDE